jgi:transcriptional regulator with XRE-family HTH domain
MGAMNPMMQLAQAVRERFPEARLELDPGQKPNSTWFLDIDLHGYTLVVEWQAHRGFGLTANRGSGYGEGADEVYPKLEAARQRLLALLASRTATEPPPVVTLDELRKARRVTQSQVADRLQVRQASIAKLERRADLRLSTLSDFIEAMGGSLVISARFPDGMERELRFPGLPSEEHSDEHPERDLSTPKRQKNRSEARRG